MSSRIFWGFLLVLVGGLFLLSNFGVLPWGIWDSLWRTWPVILILWGASVLLRPLGRKGALITGILALVAVVAVVGIAYATYRPGMGGTGQPYQTGAATLSQPLESGVESVRLKMDFGAGTIDLDGTAAEGQLATGTLGYIARSPAIVYTSSGSEADLRLSMASGAWIGSPGPRAPRWDIHLSPVPVYVIDLDTGACATEFDLSALKVSEFNLDTGASDCKVTFGDSGLVTKVRLAFGAASVTVRAPRSVGVKVSLSTGLVGTNLSQAGLTKTGETWMSKDYDAQTSRLEITVQAGVSSFNVEWVD
jgi:hypothetical protein